MRIPACSRSPPAAAATALELLVKRKQLTKTAPVPCIVREDGIAEEPRPEAGTGDLEDDAVQASGEGNEGDGATDAVEPSETDEDEGLSPISDRLLAELTAYRTLGLRNALAERPDIALVAGLHALTLPVFYPMVRRVASNSA